MNKFEFSSSLERQMALWNAYDEGVRYGAFFGFIAGCLVGCALTLGLT